MMYRTPVPRPRLAAAVALALLLPAAAHAADFETRVFSTSVAGDTVTYTLTLCNNGPAATTTIKLWLLGLTGTPTCATPAPDLEAPLPFAANSCQSFTFGLPGFPAGKVTAGVMVDATCATAETDETNNAKASTADVKPGSADYSVKAFTMDVTSTGTALSLTLCHTGAFTWSPTLKFWSNHPGPVSCATAGAEYAEAIDLPLNTCTTLTANLGTFPSGKQTGQILIDGTCIITETSESNNAKSDGYPSYTHDADIQPIWTATCATAFCHEGTAPGGGVSMKAPGTWTRLVNAASTQVPAMRRVAPYSLSGSYLWHKLKNTQATVGGTGSQMPLGATISAADLAKIKKWIEEGAPR